MRSHHRIERCGVCNDRRHSSFACSYRVHCGLRGCNHIERRRVADDSRHRSLACGNSVECNLRSYNSIKCRRVADDSRHCSLTCSHGSHRGFACGNSRNVRVGSTALSRQSRNPFSGAYRACACGTGHYWIVQDCQTPCAVRIHHILAFCARLVNAAQKRLYRIVDIRRSHKQCIQLLCILIRLVRLVAEHHRNAACIAHKRLCLCPAGKDGAQAVYAFSVVILKLMRVIAEILLNLLEHYSSPPNSIAI